MIKHNRLTYKTLVNWVILDRLWKIEGVVGVNYNKEAIPWSFDFWDSFSHLYCFIYKSNLILLSKFL